MPTTLYLRSEFSDVDPGAARDLLAGLTPGSLFTTSHTNTVLGPVGLASLQATISTGGTILQWITNPLNTVTVSGSITTNLWVAESGDANATCEIGVVRMTAAGAYVSTILDNVCGPEMALTTRAAQNWSAAPSSTTISQGQRLGIIVFYNDATALTMASGLEVSLGFAGSTGGADGDSYVTFTETITEVETRAQQQGARLLSQGSGLW